MSPTPASASLYVELSPPDITPFRKGNAGVDYYHRLDSGRAGPHVMINAVIHGNELCGAIAVAHLLESGFRPRRGQVTLGFANVEAYRTFDPRYPAASRYVDEDMNRVWDRETLSSGRDSIELRRAREILPLLDKVDFLLDLHSMSGDCGPVVLAGPLPKGLALARTLNLPADIVIDSGHAAGMRLRDHGGFGDPAAPQAALLVECGQHWRRETEAVAHAAACRFLEAFDMAEPQSAPDAGVPTRGAQRVIEVTGAVTARTTQLRFAENFQGMEVVSKAGTEIARDGGRPVVTPYDDCILIMPTHNVLPGQTAVRFGRAVQG